jgi:hypothetical protein
MVRFALILGTLALAGYVIAARPAPVSHNHAPIVPAPPASKPVKKRLQGKPDYRLN